MNSTHSLIDIDLRTERDISTNINYQQFYFFKKGYTNIDKQENVVSKNYDNDPFFYCCACIEFFLQCLCK